MTTVVESVDETSDANMNKWVEDSKREHHDLTFHRGISIQNIDEPENGIGQWDQLTFLELYIWSSF